MQCKELAKELGVTNMTIGRIRAKKWKTKGDLTPEQEKYIRAQFKTIRQVPPATDLEEQVPECVTVIVTHQGHLPRFVECMRRGHRGRFKLLLPYGTNKDAFPRGKAVPAAKVKHNEIEIYIHKTLARGKWEFIQ